MLLLRAIYFFRAPRAGIAMPFLAAHFKQRGFSDVQIGFLSSNGPLITIVLAGFLGMVADRAVHRNRLLVQALALKAAVFLAIIAAPLFSWIVLANFVFFPAQALAESLMTASFIIMARQRGSDFGKVILWSSVGFIATSLVGGKIVDWFSTTTVLTGAVGLHGRGDRPGRAAAAVAEAAAGRQQRKRRGEREMGRRGELDISPSPPLPLSLSLLRPFFSFLPPHMGTVYPPARRGRDLLRRPEIVSLLLSCFLSRMAFGAYLVFFTIHLTEVGYPAWFISMLWGLSVAAEAGVTYVSQGLVRRFGARRVVATAYAGEALRWSAFALTSAWPVLILMQLTHGLSFGGGEMGNMYFIDQRFPARFKVSGQSYRLIMMRAGDVLGSLLAGWACTALGRNWAFGISAGIAAAGALVAFIGMRAPREKEIGGEEETGVGTA